MGNVSAPRPASLIAAIMAPGPEMIGEAERRLSLSFGEIESRSETFPFDFSDYYEEEMGQGLVKEFVSFADLIETERLAGIKLLTNDIESELGEIVDGKLYRRVNIDPGYVTLGNLVLASTKYASHRIHIGRGIYAEVTLRFYRGSFRELEWTYRDYVTELAINFFNDVRRRLLKKLREAEDLT